MQHVDAFFYADYPFLIIFFTQTTLFGISVTKKGAIAVPLSINHDSGRRKQVPDSKGSSSWSFCHPARPFEP